MIIARSPLRISLGGGGTDLPSYYTEHGGFLIAGAISKYVYITLHETFFKEIIIKYSEMERVNSIDELKHPIIRETLKLLSINNSSFELTSMADIPSGTGLGSSGSFTTALIWALHAMKSENISKSQLAEMACKIEIDLLQQPIGKQDQYAAAFGGINCYEFRKNGEVTIKPLCLSDTARSDMEDSLIMFFTGFSRSASDILVEQDKKSRQNNASMIENLHFVKEMGLSSKEALEQGDVVQYGKLMQKHWHFKKQRSNQMSNATIDHWYQTALHNGAIGGKLIGAGGGGFLLFVTEKKTQLRHAMANEGLKEVRFQFEDHGTKIIS